MAEYLLGAGLVLEVIQGPAASQDLQDPLSQPASLVLKAAPRKKGALEAVHLKEKALKKTTLARRIPLHLLRQRRGLAPGQVLLKAVLKRYFEKCINV